MRLTRADELCTGAVVACREEAQDKVRAPRHDVEPQRAQGVLQCDALGVHLRILAAVVRRVRQGSHPGELGAQAHGPRRNVLAKGGHTLACEVGNALSGQRVHFGHGLAHEEWCALWDEGF